MNPKKLSGASLSVVIPVRNGGDTLLECLEALTASTRRPDEVIVVDDASTDASGQIARRFGAQVLEFQDRPHGPASARNRGAAAAWGDILVFIDADILLHPEALEGIEQIFAS